MAGVNPSDKLIRDQIGTIQNGPVPVPNGPIPIPPASIGPNTGSSAEPFNINTTSFGGLLKEILTSPQGSLFPLSGVMGAGINTGLRAPSVIQRAVAAANQASGKLGQGLDQMSKFTQFGRQNLPKAVRETRRSKASREKMNRRLSEFEQLRKKNTNPR